MDRFETIQKRKEWVTKTSVTIAVGIAAGNPDMTEQVVAERSLKISVCIGKYMGILDKYWEAPGPSSNQ